MASKTENIASPGAAPEFAAATSAVAIFAPPLGILKATGKDGLDLLNRMSTNKVVDLEPGQGTTTIMTTDRGRILDLLRVVNTGEYVLLVTSPGQQQAVIDFLDKYTIMEDLVVEDISAATAVLMVIGPEAPGLLGRSASPDTPATALTAREQRVGDEQALVVEARLGTLPCYYLIAAAQSAPDILRHFVEKGVVALSDESYEAVRISQGAPAYGSEMGEPYNPLEAGLIGSVDFTKGCYIGQEVIARLDSYKKVQKYLVTLSFSEGATAEAGSSLTQAGKAVGLVTSVASVAGQGLVGLGYVKTASALAGGKLELAAPASGTVEIKELAQLFGPGS